MRASRVLSPRASIGVSTALLEQYRQEDPDAYKRGEDGFGLDITYRAPDVTGPLVTRDRAPVTPVVDAGGTRIRLFDLFRGPHSARLVFGAVAPAEQHT
ncbi:hypothetical protein MXD59_01795 [Frankia sp. Ag45/Mut15]|uniref:Uncharacterized protein n=1 Tax=Frankia umida TaxID=573489 RepID=A0ABT0JT40_9ACTN|nr:hypothetical protein [Frankia umida]MCK9874524.1 hypothetical protein [Frankia umida]